MEHRPSRQFPLEFPFPFELRRDGLAICAHAVNVETKSLRDTLFDFIQCTPGGHAGYPIIRGARGVIVCIVNNYLNL